MNNNKRIITRIVSSAKALLLGTMVAMTCSCDDFLTILPTDKIVLEDFWKSKEDVDNMVAESYRLMSHWDFLSRMIVWGELRGDNVTEGYYSGNNDIKYIMEANLLPSNPYASWAPVYAVINNCNQVMKYAPGVLDEDPDFTQGDLDVVRGEMLALRALCHFYLVRTFRAVPVLTEAMVDDSQNLYQLQSDPVDALDQCLEDLYEAEELVLTTGNYPVQNALDNKNMGRITKDAVRTIIADIYLWKGAFLDNKNLTDKTCYEECIRYCDKVLDARMAYAEKYLAEARYNDVVLHDSYPILYPSEANGGYDADKRFPHRPYQMLFGGSSNGSNNPIESVFELQHSTSEANANYEVPYFYSYWLIGQSLPAYGMLSATRHLADTDAGLYKKTDFRRVNTVLGGKDKYAIIKYNNFQTTEENASKSEPGFSEKMTYTFPACFTADGKSGGIKDMRYIGGSKVNWIVYRISDVMLMKAEALAVLHRDAQDTLEVKKIVKAVYNRSQSGWYDDANAKVGITLPEYAFDYLFGGVDLLKLVLDERQRELAFEGKRWYDLVRVALRDKTTDDGLFKEAVRVKYSGTDDPEQFAAKIASINHLFFPIAERELKTNSGLHQNEAYKKDDTTQTN